MEDQRNIDKVALSKLSKFIGEEMDTRTVEFFLYFPTQLEAVLAEVELLNLQFNCAVSDTKENKQWLCTANKEMEVSEKRLKDLRKWLEHLASKYNGTFNGWGIEV